MPSRRIAIFGGTFDPIHNAHLEVAREAVRRFTLDFVLVIPNGNPPHKQGVERVDWAHRYRMVELACAGEERLQPSRLEEGKERSYSILTIERVKAGHPDDRIFFLIGADAFAEIHTWHRWEDVLKAVEFVVVSRPGHHYAVPDGARILPLENVALDLSSSEVRAALREGRMPSDALPPAVRDYIAAHGLYGYR